MTVHKLKLVPTQPAVTPQGGPKRTPLGHLLRQMGGALSDQDLATAVALQQREEARFGDILLANGFVTRADLYAALALQYNTSIADLKSEPPDVRLIDRLGGAEFCIQNAVLPWKRVGGATVLICSRPPDQFEALKAQMPKEFGRLHLAIATEEDIQTALIAARHRSLAIRAETRVADHESCRTWDRGPVGRLAVALLLGIIALFVAAPLSQDLPC